MDQISDVDARAFWLTCFGQQTTVDQAVFCSKLRNYHETKKPFSLKRFHLLPKIVGAILVQRQSAPVTASQFNQFCQGLGPFKVVFEKAVTSFFTDDGLVQQWYHGRLSRNESISLLQDQHQHGGYLIRNSQAYPNRFTLTYSHKDRNGRLQVINSLIYNMGSDGFAVTPNPTARHTIYRSIAAFISSNSSRLKHPVPSALHLFSKKAQHALDTTVDGCAYTIMDASVANTPPPKSPLPAASAAATAGVGRNFTPGGPGTSNNVTPVAVRAGMYSPPGPDPNANADIQLQYNTLPSTCVADEVHTDLGSPWDDSAEPASFAPKPEAAAPVPPMPLPTKVLSSQLSNYITIDPDNVASPFSPVSPVFYPTPKSDEPAANDDDGVSPPPDGNPDWFAAGSYLSVPEKTTQMLFSDAPVVSRAASSPTGGIVYAEAVVVSDDEGADADVIVT